VFRQRRKFLRLGTTVLFRKIPELIILRVTGRAKFDDEGTANKKVEDIP